MRGQVLTLFVIAAGALPVAEARNFFGLANQGFQNGGRSGVRTDTTFQFNGPLFANGRAGGDATVLDLDLRAGFNRQFNQSVELTAFHNANLGGTGEYGQPLLLPGISQQNYLLARPAPVWIGNCGSTPGSGFPLSRPEWTLIRAISRISRPSCGGRRISDPHKFARAGFSGSNSVAERL